MRRELDALLLQDVRAFRRCLPPLACRCASEHFSAPHSVLQG